MAKRNVLSLKRKIDLLKDIETKKQKQVDVASHYKDSDKYYKISLLLLLSCGIYTI